MKTEANMRRLILAIALGATIAFSIALVALSPFAFELLESINGVNWQRLSDIGQTYGAASALLSALAITGVAISLVLQAKEMASSRRQSSRTFHHELLRMAADEPRYLECWGPRLYPTLDEERRGMYCNLILSFWQMNYENDNYPENALRFAAAEHFRGEVGRQNWAKIGRQRAQNSAGRRSRRFMQILDEEYQKAVATGPPVPRGSLPQQ